MKRAAGLLGALYTQVGMAHAAERPACLACGRTMRAVGTRPRTLATRVRAVQFERPLYHCAACSLTHAPLDDELECQGRQYSPAAREWCTLLGAAVSFREAAHIVRRVTRVWADASTIEAMCAEDGTAMEEHINAAITTPRTTAAAGVPSPELLSIAVDGAKAPMRDPERPWQEVRVGVVFTPQEGAGTASIGRREYLAFRGSMEAFAPRLWERAAAWWACTAPRIVVLGDGAKANWSMAESRFPGAVQIVDCFHATEPLAAIKDCLVFPTAALAEKWYHTACRALKRGRWTTVMKLIHAVRCAKSDVLIWRANAPVLNTTARVCAMMCFRRVDGTSAAGWWNRRAHRWWASVCVCRERAGVGCVVGPC